MEIPVDKQELESFWRWLEAHKRELDRLEHPDDYFWQEILGRLRVFSERLYIEVSALSTGTFERELIITTHGRRELFSVADRIVANALQIPGWKFISLKPAMGFDFKSCYEGIEFEPKSIWFTPLAKKLAPQFLGLRIGIPGLTPDINRQAANAVRIILDTALGERTSALEIHYVETVVLPEKPREAGYIELPKLPRYIEWRKERVPAS